MRGRAPTRSQGKPGRPEAGPRPANGPANGATPPGAATTTTATASTAPTGPSSSRKDSTTNYELDRSIRHVQQGAGAIKRLSVAVVVNNLAGAEGKSRALAPAEVEQIRNLVKEAMGYSQERGDSLNVLNSAFARDGQDEPQAEVPLWKDRDNIELAKSIGQYLLLGVLALFAWFAVLRPLLRKHLAPPPSATPEAAPPAAAVAADPDDETSAAQLSALQREAERRQADLDYVQQTAEQDPRLVATLIKHWMNP